MKTGFVRLFVCGIFICSHSEEPLKLCCSCACCGSYGYKESMFYIPPTRLSNACVYLIKNNGCKKTVCWVAVPWFQCVFALKKNLKTAVDWFFLKELRPASNARHLSLITKHAILIIHSSTYIHLQSLFFGKYQSM